MRIKTVHGASVRVRKAMQKSFNTLTFHKMLNSKRQRGWKNLIWSEKTVVIEIDVEKRSGYPE